MKYRNIVNRDNKILCNKTMSIVAINVEVHPGIALSVKSRMPKIIPMTITENINKMEEKINNLLAILSIKTEMDPSPCKSNA